MTPLIVIPARYKSKRFPGKPLAMIGDKPMIQHTYEQAKKTGITTIVATDDDRIESAVKNFQGEVVITSKLHQNGTSRCEEAVNIQMEKTNISYDVIVNVQGDEPFIRQEQIHEMLLAFEDCDTDIATLCKVVDNQKCLENPNVVKLVKNSSNQAMYFSRSVIPYYRDLPSNQWLYRYNYFKHIGMYAYRREVLNAITCLSKGSLEQVENLEQLRWLEQGYTIAVRETNFESIGIDTPEDLKILCKERNK